MTPATAAKVTEAIDALGFERNDLARSLRQGRTSSTLGLVIEDVANPFYSSVAQAVEAVASERGFLLITASALEDAERERELIGALLRRRVDALLIVPAGPDHRYISSAARTRLPRPPAAGDRGRHRAARQPRRRPPRRRAPDRPRPHADRLRRRHGGPLHGARAPDRLPRGAERRRARGGSRARRQRQPRRDRRAGRRRAPARRCPTSAARPRSSPPTTATPSARCTRSPAASGRSRSSASTTSSWPTCSAPPSCAPIPGASASRRRRSRSRASTATTARRSRSPCRRS